MIVDANPIISACLGRSKSLFRQLIVDGADLYVPEHQMHEARAVTWHEAPRHGLEPIEAFGWASELLSVVPGSTYWVYEAEARARLKRAGPTSQGKDWPLIALALASGDDVWSNDTDLFGTGIAVWNTHNIRRSIEQGVPADDGGSGN